MSPLSPLFLWLLPLALLPVVIHLLNRLRYQTVRWAAMMFLRTADRDASRRARIRQWIILAMRCLMLAAFLLALARLQSKGRLAKFLDRGTSLVVVVFDRSAGMEQQRGGATGRERALGLVQQGLAELAPGARVLWLDGATGEVTPVPAGVDLSRLPLTRGGAGMADQATLLRTALQEVARAGVASAEIWIPTDRRVAAWMPEGASLPDWSEWGGLDTQVTIRLLDVAQIPADGGNRALQLVGEPQREGEQVFVPLRLVRDRAEAERVTLTLDLDGIALTETLQVEGTSFRWEQAMPLSQGKEELTARLWVPADSNNADNEVAVAWKGSGPVKARVDLSDARLARVVKAGLLPRPGVREVTDSWAAMDGEVALWVREAGDAPSDSERAWMEAGGIGLTLPLRDSLREVGETPMMVSDWKEQTGLLASEGGEALRLDLLRVEAMAELELGEGVEVLATLGDGSPLLTRREVGEGGDYALATLPDPAASNLDAGFIWVPLLQRALQEGRRRETRWGGQRLGDWRPGEGEEWEAIDGVERDPLLDTGRYTFGNHIVALNRPLEADKVQTLEVEEIREWAKPLDLRVFEDRSESGEVGPRRVELTSLLSLFGLLFLGVESFLLTRNVRRPSAARGAWSSAS